MSKIDYEITVDVSNLTKDEKKRVQDAFFKLGLEWRDDGNKHVHLDESSYTNAYQFGVTAAYLMFNGVGRNPTHTVDELLELAGMKNEANLKPFDLAKALAGEPVVLRDGSKAYIRHHETEFETDYPLIGYAIYSERVFNESWTEEGGLYADKGESEYDIAGMWSEPLVFEHWGLLREDVKYLAKDSDGRWFGHSRKPVLEDEVWNIDGTLESTRLLKPTIFPECNWEESLMERPENE